MTPRFHVPEGLSCLAVMLFGVARRGAGAHRDSWLAAPEFACSSHDPQSASKLTDEGLATRTVCRADGSAIYDVEVRELVATPGKDCKDVNLNGGALLEVRSGSGLARVAGRTQELRRGSTLELDDGTLVTLEATGNAPIVLRAHVVRAR